MDSDWVSARALRDGSPTPCASGLGTSVNDIDLGSADCVDHAPHNPPIQSLRQAGINNLPCGSSIVRNGLIGKCLKRQALERGWEAGIRTPIPWSRVFSRLLTRQDFFEFFSQCTNQFWLFWVGFSGKFAQNSHKTKHDFRFWYRVTFQRHISERFQRCASHRGNTTWLLVDFDQHFQR